MEIKENVTVTTMRPTTLSSVVIWQIAFVGLKCINTFHETSPMWTVLAALSHFTPLRLYSTHRLPPSHHEPSPFCLSPVFLWADNILPKLKSIVYEVWLHTLNCCLLCFLYSHKTWKGFSHSVLETCTEITHFHW